MTKTYWNKKGKHQKDYDRLLKLVPDIGRAETMHGNLLRHIGKIYYDYYNNGLCNAENLFRSVSFLEEYDHEICRKLGKNKDNLRELSTAYGRYINEIPDTSEANEVELPHNFPKLLERVTDAIILVVKNEDRKR